MLEDFLSQEALKAADEKFAADEAAHEKRVAETTAKRRANNKAMFAEEWDNASH